jgi:outer membrane protein
MRTSKQFVKSGILAAMAAGAFMACQQPNKGTTPATTTKGENTETTANNGFIIAYVDIDSVEANYNYFKEKKAELEKKRQAIDNELNANVRALQNEIGDFQRRAQGMTQTEGEAAQRTLGDKQQQLEAKAQNMRSNYAEQENKFNEDLQKRLNDFLQKFNSNKKYAYILSYRYGASNILAKDEKYDITKEVIEGLNSSNEPEKK